MASGGERRDPGGAISLVGIVTGVAGVAVGPVRGVLSALEFPLTTTPAATARWWGVGWKEILAVFPETAGRGGDNCGGCGEGAEGKATKLFWGDKAASGWSVGLVTDRAWWSPCEYVEVDAGCCCGRAVGQWEELNWGRRSDTQERAEKKLDKIGDWLVGGFSGQDGRNVQCSEVFRGV